MKSLVPLVEPLLAELITGATPGLLQRASALAEERFAIIDGIEDHQKNGRVHLKLVRGRVDHPEVINGSIIASDLPRANGENDPTAGMP
jgi:hypothetical protein